MPGLKKKHRRESYGQVKMNTTTEELTRNLPQVFFHYFRYVETLKFMDKPDYDYCRKLFYDSLLSHNFVFDEVFDWSLPCLNNTKHG